MFFDKHSISTAKKLKPKMMFWSTNTLNKANAIFRDSHGIYSNSNARSLQ